MDRQSPRTRRMFLKQTATAAAALPLAVRRSAAADLAPERPHLVFVVGTHHYNPETTMPPLAQEMERFGFRTTVVLPPGDPEENKNGVGLPGLEALDQADAAVFFLRWLTLDDAQFAHIEKYVKSGKPVVAFRTSTHAFRYPKDHSRFAWNDGFGQDVVGTFYLVHLQGSTQCRVVEEARTHPILAGVGEESFTSAGTLYITNLQPGCKPLVLGSGSGKEERTLKKGSFERLVKKDETDVVAWTWEKNAYGARVFSTSFGHPGDFAVPQIMRIVVNGIHWAAGCPVPDASAEVRTLTPLAA
ncbi:MAG: ThuA domain-containing protein [Candidatus Sumerlaeota bacterium]|nr:ThuA domain-containing protein [Candidatus Sumerlaeota bacterium]